MSQEPYRTPDVPPDLFEHLKKPCACCGTKTLTILVVRVANPHGWPDNGEHVPACSNTCAEALLSAKQVVEAVNPEIAPQSRSSSGSDMFGERALGVSLTGMSTADAARRMSEIFKKSGF